MALSSHHPIHFYIPRVRSATSNYFPFQFLNYTLSKGNDLITPAPEYDFPGLKAGDKWCICALRWGEAEKAGKAPKVDLDASEVTTLDYHSIQDIRDVNDGSYKNEITDD